MEPVGAAASVLTLLIAAGQSSKFLYNLCIDLSEAPSDAKKQATQLRCLNFTIHQLIQAYEKLPKDFEVDARLRQEIARFESEVTSMRTRVETKFDLSGQGWRQRLRENSKWLLFDRHMKKFLQSADRWSLIMSHASIIAQMALSTRIDQNVSTLIALTQPTTCFRTSIETSNQALPPRLVSQSLASAWTMLPDTERQQGRHMISRFEQYLSSSAEPDGLMPQHCVSIGKGWTKFSCTSGPVVCRYWSPERKEKYKLLRASEGFGLQIVAYSSWLAPTRYSFSMFATYAASNALKLGLQCNLQCARLFTFGGPHHLAIQRGDVDYFKRKISSRTLNVFDVTSHGDTLLHLAAGHNQRDLIDFLVREGVDVNAMNNTGETALHISLRIGKNYECARRLLGHGADIHRENKDGRTALHSFFNDAISQVIRYHKDDIDASCQDRRGMTIAHWASWTSQSSPRDITYQCPVTKEPFSPFYELDVHGKSMLHFAAERGNVQLVQYLLSQPQASKMLALDYEGRNLLHFATASSRFPMIQAMIQCSQLDMRHRDHQGGTILHHAAVKNNLSALKHILVRCPDLLYSQNNDGRTPLQLAQLRGYTSVVEFLASHYQQGALPMTEKHEMCEKVGLDTGFNLGKQSRLWEQHLIRRLSFLSLCILVLQAILWICGGL